MVTVTGIAQTNERVSEFLRNTAYNSPWLERPELVEIKAANVADRQPRAAAPVRLLDARDDQAAAGRGRRGRRRPRRRAAAEAGRSAAKKA